jgi:hypothetical protein
MLSRQTLLRCSLLSKSNATLRHTRKYNSIYAPKHGFHCADFHQPHELSTSLPLPPNSIQIGQNVWEIRTETHLPSMVFTAPVFIKITLAPEHSVKNFFAEFHENPTKCLVTDNGWRTDGHGLHIRDYLLRKERPKGINGFRAAHQTLINSQ